MHSQANVFQTLKVISEYAEMKHSQVKFTISQIQDLARVNA